jgi:cytosine/adenosine deaminase-related metal-dependent hydrolase
MATINSARALGMRGKIGELAPGAFADVIALPLAGKVGEIAKAILAHTGSVSASMIEGRWAMPPK